MKDKREFLRQVINFKVNVTFSNHESSILKARDISKGGMYLASKDTEQPCIGELLHIKLAEDLGINESIHYGDAVVVHKGRNGFGLSFVEMNDLL